MISGTSILLAVVGCIFGYIFMRRKKWENSPPGPWRKGWPLVGNALEMEPILHKTLSKWADQYGPLYRTDLAVTKVVVLSDHKLVKEAFSESSFTGRMDFKIFDFVPDKEVPMHGLVNTEGKHWEDLRRFTLRQLRDYGFGKSSMEDSIMVEVNDVISSLKKEVGKPVDKVKDRFFMAVVNALWVIMTGKRMQQDDPKVMALAHGAHKEMNQLLETSQLYLFMPKLAEWFPNLTGYAKLRKSFDDFATYFRGPRDEHLRTFVEEEERDFVDTFIKEMRRTTDTSSAFYGKLGEDNLLAVMIDLYFAGSDTTATTLAWMILYLSKHPEVQKKFQQEIETVTGGSRQVSVTDRPDMPYTEAVVAETLRFSSIVGVGPPHKATQDTQLLGYNIPKGTILFANFHYIHHDPKVWGDPENFRPERFLTPEGTFKKPDALMPFSIGRRQCLGESLARDSIFLFSTNVFQRFWIEFDKSGPDHGFEPETAFTTPPKPYRVILKERDI